MAGTEKILSQEEMDTLNFLNEKGRLLNRAEAIVKSLENIPEQQNGRLLDDLIKDMCFLQLSTIMFSRRNKR